MNKNCKKCEKLKNRYKKLRQTQIDKIDEIQEEKQNIKQEMENELRRYIKHCRLTQQPTRQLIKFAEQELGMVVSNSL